MSLSKESLVLHEAFQWDVEKIKSWLKAITSLVPEMNDFWTVFFKPHFDQQTSYGLGFDGKALLQMPYKHLYSAEVKVNSCFCALAIVINRALPPYDSAIGSTDEYSFSVLILTARWSKVIGAAGPDPHRFPLFFSVLCIEREQLEPKITKDFKITNDLVLIVGTTNSLNVNGDEAEMRQEWDRSRLPDLAACFEDNEPNKPHLLDPENNLRRKEEPVMVCKEAKSLSEGRALYKTEDIRACIERHRGSLLGEAMELYLSKRVLKKVEKSVGHDFGSCAETYGFIVSARIVKPGGHAKLFSIAAEVAAFVEIIEGYKTYAKYPKPSKPPKFKQCCDNCVYLISAFKVKYGITIDESNYKIEGEPKNNKPDPIHSEKQPEEAGDADGIVEKEEEKKQEEKQKKKKRPRRRQRK